MQNPTHVGRGRASKARDGLWREFNVRRASRRALAQSPHLQHVQQRQADLGEGGPVLRRAAHAPAAGGGTARAAAFRISPASRVCSATGPAPHGPGHAGRAGGQLRRNTRRLGGRRKTQRRSCGSGGAYLPAPDGEQHRASGRDENAHASGADGPAPDGEQHVGRRRADDVLAQLLVARVAVVLGHPRRQAAVHDPHEHAKAAQGKARRDAATTATPCRVRGCEAQARASGTSRPRAPHAGAQAMGDAGAAQPVLRGPQQKAPLAPSFPASARAALPPPSPEQPC